MRLLLLLFLGRALGVVPTSDQDEVFGRKSNPSLVNKHQPSDGDDKMIRRIEEEMLSLNKSGDPIRDKRALGILLQGFMEALGYTVAPIQIASLANPTPAASSPAMSSRQQAAAPPPAPANASAPPPSRQRETLRFTGVLNFGNNANTSNLVNHLAQYERLFHGNGSVAPPPVPAPNIDPRSRPPLPEPLFVQIPLPIAPNLPPPQPPSPMPVQNTYNDEYSKDHAEEYQGSKDDEGQQGNYEEEDDRSQHNEEYEHQHEQYDEPEDRNYNYHESEERYDEEPPRAPKDKNTEKEYKKNENIVNYSIENKEIHDPSEVSEESPIVGSKYNHAMYVGEPDWKQEHENHLYKLAAEHEAKAEALAEENAEREEGKSREHEEADLDFHRSREKEIDDRNEAHSARYHSGENQAQAPSSYSDEDDYEEETKISEKKPSTTNKVPTENNKLENKPATRRYEEDDEEEEVEEDDDKSENPKRYDDDEEEAKEEEDDRSRLPISYDREQSRQNTTLRDSYGESLEKPGGKIDERVAGYITMFKNPRTGVYDPSRIKQYESARVPHDHEELLNGYRRIQNEYGQPENKYEEYELDSEKPEHREIDYQPERTEPIKSVDCDCSTRNADVQSEEARSPGKSVTTALPPYRSTSYGPYYSTVKYLYDPLEYDQGIIARLTSYDPPTTVRFEDVRATHPPPSERPTIKSLHQDVETKEIKTWPAPFDYAYDNSEHSDVVVRGTTQSPLKTTPYEPTRPDCNQEARTLPPGLYSDKVNKLLQDFEKGGSRSVVNGKAHRGGRRVEQKAHHTNKVGFYAPIHITEPTIQRKRPSPSNTERSTLRHRNRAVVTHPPLTMETRTPHPSRIRGAKTFGDNIFNSSRMEMTTRYPKPNRPISRSKSMVKKKHHGYPLIPNSKEESSNYVEKDGILIIPEPTPYYYNERVDEFTEEPPSGTERVKIKEYRNRIESVKVSQLKQLHPEGSMQIVKYTRHL